MAATINFKNNYSFFFEDFKADTGLDAKSNVKEYLLYFNARTNDQNLQLNWQLGELFLNRMNELKR